MNLAFNNRSLGRITISIGIAMYPVHGSSEEELISAADKALYRAKQEGRDRIIIATDVITKTAINY